MKVNFIICIYNTLTTHPKTFNNTWTTLESFKKTGDRDSPLNIRIFDHDLEVIYVLGFNYPGIDISQDWTKQVYWQGCYHSAQTDKESIKQEQTERTHQAPGLQSSTPWAHYCTTVKLTECTGQEGKLSTFHMHLGTSFGKAKMPNNTALERAGTLGMYMLLKQRC